MRITKLLNQYKSISNEMRKEAKNYNYLCDSVKTSSSKDTFKKYNESWKKLIRLNENGYKVMYEYRKLCDTFFYRFLFSTGILPKQHTFRFVNESKTQFKCDLLINLLYLK